MPALRQQDHRLNKDELVTYKYSVILVEVQSGVRSFAISQTVLIIFVTISVVFPREILINKNAQVFYVVYVNFRLEMNIFILFIIKHAKFWLVSKSLLVRIENYKVGFITKSARLILGGTCVSKSIGLAIVGKEFMSVFCTKFSLKHAVRT